MKVFPTSLHEAFHIPLHGGFFIEEFRRYEFDDHAVGLAD
jgi:hypothetical protein